MLKIEKKKEERKAAILAGKSSIHFSFSHSFKFFFFFSFIRSTHSFIFFNTRTHTNPSNHDIQHPRGELEHPALQKLPYLTGAQELPDVGVGVLHGRVALEQLRLEGALDPMGPDDVPHPDLVR